MDSLKLWTEGCFAQCCAPQSTNVRIATKTPKQLEMQAQVHHGEDIPDFSQAKLDAISLRQAREGWTDKHPICITSVKEGALHSITHVNKAFLKLMRVKKRDILRKPLSTMCGKATDKVAFSKLLRHLSAGAIGKDMTMIVYPFPQTLAPQMWVDADCHPLKDGVGNLAFNKIRFNVGEPVRTDILWYWERRNDFADFNEIESFEKAFEVAEAHGGRFNRHLQSNQHLVEARERQIVSMDPHVSSPGRTTIVVRTPSGNQIKHDRHPSRHNAKSQITQDVNKQAPPDGVLRTVVRSPFLLDEQGTRLSASFQYHRTRVERERLEMELFSKPDPNLLSDMRRLKETIQKVDGNFVTAGVNMRALKEEVALKQRPPSHP